MVRLSSIGDIILTTPLLRSLKKSFPQAQITFVIKKQYEELLCESPYIDKLIKYQEFVEEMYKEIACDMDKKEIRKNYVDINMGKYLSSKGQYMSFINEASAEKYFLEALGCFKYNDKQKNQAISYLIHYYSYFEIVPENNIRQIIDKYFGLNYEL